MYKMCNHVSVQTWYTKVQETNIIYKRWPWSYLGTTKLSPYHMTKSLIYNKNQGKNIHQKKGGRGKGIAREGKRWIKVLFTHLSKFIEIDQKRHHANIMLTLMENQNIRKVYSLYCSLYKQRLSKHNPIKKRSKIEGRRGTAGMSIVSFTVRGFYMGAQTIFHISHLTSHGLWAQWPQDHKQHIQWNARQ